MAIATETTLRVANPDVSLVGLQTGSDFDREHLDRFGFHCNFLYLCQFARIVHSTINNDSKSRATYIKLARES